MRSSCRISLICSAICLLAIGGGCKKKTAPIGADQTLPTAAPTSIQGVNATEAETKSFADQLVAAASANDTATCITLLSLEDLAIRCVSDLQMSAKNRQSLIGGMRKALQQNAIVTAIQRANQNGGSLKHLRTRTADGRPRAIIRMLDGEGAVIYWELVITRYTDGHLGIDDIYVHAGGEMISQSMRRLLLPAVAELNRGSMGKILGQDRLFLDNATKIKAFGDAVKAENYKAAVDVFHSLPEELRQNKTIQLIYLSALENFDEEMYSNALASFRKLFPNDPAVDILSIDYYLLRKQWDEALKSVNTTDKAVGGDPYLDVIRSRIQLGAERPAEAKKFAERAIEAERTLADAYSARLDVALKEKNHKDTLAWLKKMFDDVDLEFDDMDKNEDFADFVKSPEYKEWQKWRKSKDE